jgi:hypothetical protein
MSYKLEAVNRCLRAIGESRVNSLNSGVPDAETAATLVDETTRTVLSSGWHSNTAFDVRLIPNLDKEIIVPSNAIQIDSTGKSFNINVTTSVDISDNIRKLFNIKDQSYKFDGPIYVDIIYDHPIDNLPFHLQNYISARAARLFQAGTMSSVALDAFVKIEESEAWAKLMDVEAQLEDSNVFRDSPSARRIVYRNRG